MDLSDVVSSSYSISQPSSAYGYVISGDKHWIDPFWSRFESFESAENPIFFHRQYYGDPKGSESYYELNQLITHLFDLHWSKNKTAYCKLNDLGDEVEKIKITGLL